MSAVYQRLRRTNRTREDRLSSSALNSSHLSLHSYLLTFHFFIYHPPHLYILSLICDVFYFFLDALASLKTMIKIIMVSDVFKISRLQSIREFC